MSRCILEYNHRERLQQQWPIITFILIKYVDRHNTYFSLISYYNRLTEKSSWEIPALYT